jgi:5-methylcytosine-specific restriction endonuclease McrA
MFGRKHTAETKRKMSISRTGKLGPNATAWKGGKSSLTCRVKKIIHTRYGWYAAVLRRDGWKCTECGSKKKIEPHHIEAVVVIIKRLTEGTTFDSDEEKIEWLVIQPEIEDPELKNGITFCRECHKKAHNNWGSHDRP